MNFYVYGYTTRTRAPISGYLEVSKFAEFQGRFFGTTTPTLPLPYTKVALLISYLSAKQLAPLYDNLLFVRSQLCP